MGWFWSSTSPEATSPTSPSTPSTTASSASQSQTTSQSIPQPSSSNSSKDDAELDKFMAMLQGNTNGVSSAASQTTQTTQTSASTEDTPSKLSAWKSVWPGSSDDASQQEEKEKYVARERSLAEAVLPVQMSCRQAFDMAWACQSPAGQWRAVYRHGGVRPCSELWDDFWFCMRVKGYGEGPLKEEAVREYYRKKEMDKYYKTDTPSSEDVWRSRTVDEVLAPGEVFQNSFQAVLKKADAPVEMTAASNPAKIDDGREDANQILADAERRQRIRREMGYKS